jgi:hypothetical protein
MKRRDFLQLLTAGAAITVARVPWPTAETPSLDEIDSNYWALNQRIRQLVERGYPPRDFTLEAEDGGFRFLSVRLYDQPPLTWHQPWALVTHQRENIHYDFHACDCGAKTLTQHDWRCSRATHLAHHLRGDWSRYRKTDPDVEIDHLDVLRSIRRSRRGLTPDIGVPRLDRTLQDLHLAGIDLVPCRNLSRKWRPPVGYAYTHRCDWHTAGLAGRLYERKLRCLVCETEYLHPDWMLYPVLLPHQWYLVRGRANIHAIHIS